MARTDYTPILLIGGLGLGAYLLFSQKENIDKTLGGVAEASQGIGGGISQVTGGFGTAVEGAGQGLNTVFREAGETAQAGADFIQAGFEEGTQFLRKASGMIQDKIFTPPAIVPEGSRTWYPGLAAEKPTTIREPIRPTFLDRASGVLQSLPGGVIISSGLRAGASVANKLLGTTQEMPKTAVSRSSGVSTPKRKTLVQLRRNTGGPTVVLEPETKKVYQGKTVDLRGTKTFIGVVAK